MDEAPLSHVCDREERSLPQLDAILHIVLEHSNDCIARSPPKLNHLFIDPLPTFPENVMQIRLEVFAPSC